MPVHVTEKRDELGQDTFVCIREEECLIKQLSRQEPRIFIPQYSTNCTSS